MAEGTSQVIDNVITSEREKLSLYKAQLDAINEMLKPDNDAEDLVAARNDLEELIKLSEESILAAEKAKLLAQVDQMAEQSGSETFEEQPLKADEGSIADNFSDFVGGLCHTIVRSSRTGRTIRHAVMVLGLEHTDEAVEDDANVRVLFIHPTDLWMVPCEYFLQERCTFQDKCRFSHGHVIKLKHILEYAEPDRSKLTPGSPCLALRKRSSIEVKHVEPPLWQEAEVVSVSPETVVVQFPGSNFDAPSVLDSLTQDEVIPLCNDEDVEEGVELWEEQINPLPTPHNDEKAEEPQYAASWEAHTRGIGSKLLAKMGWLGPGTGIGSADQGRSEPIPVEVMPKGMSLDTFLHLRNEAGMVTLGKGAIKMLKSKAAQALIRNEQQQQAVNEKQKQTASREEHFFSFLNESVKSTMQPSDDGPSPLKKSKTDHTKDMSDKDIGIKLLQTSERIRKTEQEIAKMNESLARLQRGRPAGQKLSESSDVERLKRRIADANAQLNALRSQEKQAVNQRSSERDRRKLTIF